MRFHSFAFVVVMVVACSSSDEDGASTSSTSTGTTTSTSTSTTTTTSATGGTGGTSSAGGGGEGGSGGSCTWSASSNPCPGGYYCDAPGCTTGTCQPLGTTDDPVKQPVCGCDNVNYWNAATAAVHGMPVASMGECAMPAWCGGFATIPCPDTAVQFCAYLYPTEQDCNIADGSGICWGMPQTCSQIGFGGSWRACFGNPSDPCLEECDAIKTQSAHWNDMSGCPM
jgi:hypothetical protein